MAKETDKDVKSLSKAFGTGVEIHGFLDGKARVAIPATLADFKELMGYVREVDVENIATNFFFENPEAITGLLDMTFRDDDIEEILNCIDASNYKQIMTDVLETHGLKIKGENEKDDIKNQ